MSKIEFSPFGYHELELYSLMRQYQRNHNLCTIFTVAYMNKAYYVYSFESVVNNKDFDYEISKKTFEITLKI